MQQTTDWQIVKKIMDFRLYFLRICNEAIARSKLWQNSANKEILRN